MPLRRFARKCEEEEKGWKRKRRLYISRPSLVGPIRVYILGSRALQ
jgi:hypothetical protein